MYGYNAESHIAIPIYTVLPYCVIQTAHAVDPSRKLASLAIRWQFFRFPLLPSRSTFSRFSRVSIQASRYSHDSISPFCSFLSLLLAPPPVRFTLLFSSSLLLAPPPVLQFVSRAPPAVRFSRSNASISYNNVTTCRYLPVRTRAHTKCHDSSCITLRGRVKFLRN